MTPSDPLLDPLLVVHYAVKRITVRRKKLILIFIGWVSVKVQMAVITPTPIVQTSKCVGVIATRNEPCPHFEL